MVVFQICKCTPKSWL